MSDTITFINHATALIQINGVNIITDPVYSRTVAFIFPRLKQPGILFENLPRIDYVLISHNHYDHLNLKTLRRLRRAHQPTIIVPKGVATYARRTGFNNIIEMNWWEGFENNGMKVTCVPAKHFSGRTLWDRNKSVFCGYVIETRNSTVYFAGDTAYADFFKELSNRFSIDIALLPIGAYKPEWFQSVHMNPIQAVQAFLDLRAKHLIPIHWGTFKISDEPSAEPPILLKKESGQKKIMDEVHILENGEQFCFSTREHPKIISGRGRQPSTPTETV